MTTAWRMTDAAAVTSDDGVESEVDDSDDSDVDSECLSDTDGPATSAAGACGRLAARRRRRGRRRGGAERAASSSVSEDEVEDLESDQERDPIDSARRALRNRPPHLRCETGEERERFCGSVECWMELEGDELRECYLSRLSESARWDELFVLEGRGDAALTMRHPALAQHGLVAKLRTSREAVARLPSRVGRQRVPEPTRRVLRVLRKARRCVAARLAGQPQEAHGRPAPSRISAVCSTVRPRSQTWRTRRRAGSSRTTRVLPSAARTTRSRRSRASRSRTPSTRARCPPRRRTFPSSRALATATAGASSAGGR